MYWTESNRLSNGSGRVESMIEQNGQMTFGARLFQGRTMLYVSEVAEKLRITEQQVRNLIDEGKLGAINVGLGERRFWRVPTEELQRFLEKNFSIQPIQPTQG